MNLSYLKYAVEVEKTGSITKAAQNFYMNQPHLSKIIRELERDLGSPIFDRTGRGMVPTQKGEEFLRYAKAILVQEEQLLSLCSANTQDMLQLRLCGPRATYISCAFNQFLCSGEHGSPMNVHYMETNSKDVIRLVSSREFDLGIVRFQVLYEPYYRKMLQAENLESKLLWEFPTCVLMSPDHPLAQKKHLTYLDFSDSIEIVQGDSQSPALSVQPQDPYPTGQRSHRSVAIYDRGSQFELLRQLPGSYMWTSPIPYHSLVSEKLIQRPCSYPGNLHRDLLITRSGYLCSKAETGLIQNLNRIISQLSD